MRHEKMTAARIKFLTNLYVDGEIGAYSNIHADQRIRTQDDGTKEK